MCIEGYFRCTLTAPKITERRVSATAAFHFTKFVRGDNLGRLSLQAGLAKKALKATSGFLAIATFVLAPLPLGSTDVFWICIWTVLMSVSILTADFGRASREDLRLLLPLFLSLAVVAIVVALQIWPTPPVGQASPVWEMLRQVLGMSVPGRISTTATGPWLSLGYSMLLCLTFTRAVFLAMDEKAAQRLIRTLAWAGFLYALYGILAQIADPGAQLLRSKEAYIGYATGTFVNRNTAATFWGTCALLFLVPLLRLIHRRDRGDVPPSDQPVEMLSYYLMSPLALGIGFAVCTVATAMTGSRAGLLLSICAFLMAGALYLAPLRLGHLRRWGLLAGALGLALVLFEFIGGAVVGRIVSYGMVDEQRLGAYRSSLAMIREHPLLGIGLGNFEATFPQYRLPELGSLGIWDRAHSTPLELAIELGLPTTALIVATCLWYVYLLLNGSLHRRRNRYIPIVGASVAVLGFLHSSIDFSLQIPGFGVFFSAITGCGIAQCFPSYMRKNDGRFVEPELS